MDVAQCCFGEVLVLARHVEAVLGDLGHVMCLLAAAIRCPDDYDDVHLSDLELMESTAFYANCERHIHKTYLAPWCTTVIVLGWIMDTTGSPATNESVEGSHDSLIRFSSYVAGACLLLYAAEYAREAFVKHASFVHDGSFITMRYARNVASGQGFVWNLGER